MPGLNSFLLRQYLIGAAIYLLIFFIELLASFLIKKKGFPIKDTIVNFFVYIGNSFILAFWAPFAGAIYYWFYAMSPVREQHLIFQRGWSSPVSWLALIIAEDFCFYWCHRFSHHYRFFWASHECHHSSNHFNLSIAGRQSWTPFCVFIFWLPLPFLGFDPAMIMTQTMISAAIQSLMHTEMIPKIGGPINYLFNTPSSHRVHHGVDDKYANKNFAAIFVIWDRIFGSYQAEEETPIYGIKPSFQSSSPFVIGLRGYGHIFRDIYRSLTVRSDSKLDA